MTEHPIIFSAPMVQALLDGRKTMTRRLAWNQTKPSPGVQCRHGYDACPECDAPKPSPWQRVQPGDRRYVREAWRTLNRFNSVEPKAVPLGAMIAYTADEPRGDRLPVPIGRMGKQRPSIHMPRWASRLTLTVTATKVERLQEINEEDARAEGVLYVPGHGEITPSELRCDPGYSNFLNCRQGFEVLWNSLHGADAWEANPEVVALSFIVERRNIDAPAF